jgi:GTP-binding protein HflX
VNKTLAEMGAGNIPTVLVLNKIDLLEKKQEKTNFEELKGYYRQLGFQNVIFISATSKENVTELKKLLYEEVKKKHRTLYPNYLGENSNPFEVAD